MRGKAPLLPHSQYISCKYNKTGKIHSLIAFYKLFLRDTEVKILNKFLALFDSFFCMCPPCDLHPHFSVNERC